MPTIFLIGGTGFIGRAVVAEALDMGFDVRALARSDSTAATLRSAGAEPVRGSAEESEWIEEARGADVLIDLAQPALPSRLTRRAVRRVVDERTAIVAAALGALEGLPAAERPIYFAVSGADDLRPDSSGVISHESPLRSGDAGFASIGVPVHRLVAGSGVDATFVHFGVMVYGPGKGFADIYVDGLRKGRAAVIGDGGNRLPLTHVSDAARALVHLAGLPRDQLAGRTFLAADGSDTTQGELLDQTAELMGVKRARRVPSVIAGLVGGRVAVEAMTFDAHADNSALIASGFEFRYPSPRVGLPPTLAQLGELEAAAGD
jgi:nucleoside-diphosphate-sugar epimerase